MPILYMFGKGGISVLQTSIFFICKAKSRKYQGVFKVKSQEKTQDREN